MAAVLHDTADEYEREYQRIRATFIEAGSSLNKWLLDNNIERRLAYRALKGQSFGRKAVEIRLKILGAASLMRSAS